MDLLGSILGKMDAPPSTPVDEETKKKVQEAKKREAKFKEDERKRKAQFREQIEIRVNKFLQGPSEEKKMVFEVMDKLHRSIAHDVSETAGLASYSFGEEDVDRHLIVWKKEYAPSEEELEALRNGEEYDPVKAAQVAEERKCMKAAELTEEKQSSRKRRTKNADMEQEKYFEKYAKIVGEDSGLNSARLAKSNESYGMVPSKNKQDKRSIEETMKEIRERKKLKMQNPQQNILLGTATEEQGND